MATKFQVCSVEVNGVTHRLCARHLELHLETGVLGWVKAGCGWLSAAGAPSRKTVRSWIREGATCVVSLLRESEPHFSLARDACEEAGLRWAHVPLSGKGAVTRPDARDLSSWKHLAKLIPDLMAAEEHVILHCAAGLHRTGAAAYSSLRRADYDVDRALRGVAAMRSLTHGELLKTEKRFGKPLWALAEELLCGDL
eukprot:TRINITY_DN71830_c0_g1_i1.p1 TRINITY_DN71830_c0_g1~~TRINITY_DN71830_c0_g1_i1.p1  ORF type:complete len:207 (-),score=33.45 TRINITY_DN71830_c0_g1_i1:72-662(-)